MGRRVTWAGSLPRGDGESGGLLGTGPGSGDVEGAAGTEGLVRTVEPAVRPPRRGPAKGGSPESHSRILTSPLFITGKRKKEVFAKTASGVNTLGVRGSQPTAGLGETGEVQTAKPAVVPEQSSGTKSLHLEFLPEPETRRARPCAHARFMLRPAPGT